MGSSQHRSESAALGVGRWRAPPRIPTVLLSSAGLMRTHRSSQKRGPRCPSLEPVSHSELGAGPFNTKGGPKAHPEGRDGRSKPAATRDHKGYTPSSQVSGQEGQGRAHSASPPGCGDTGTRTSYAQEQQDLAPPPYPPPDTHTPGRCSVSPAGSGRGRDCGSPQLLGPPDFRSRLRSTHPRCVRGSRPLPPDPKP